MGVHDESFMNLEVWGPTPQMFGTLHSCTSPFHQDFKKYIKPAVGHTFGVWRTDIWHQGRVCFLKKPLIFISKNAAQRRPNTIEFSLYFHEKNNKKRKPFEWNAWFFMISVQNHDFMPLPYGSHGFGALRDLKNQMFIWFGQLEGVVCTVRLMPREFPVAVCPGPAVYEFILKVDFWMPWGHLRHGLCISSVGAANVM